MAELSLNINDIPSLQDKVVVLTGGASGIGLAAARIFASKGAQVHILDLVPVDEKFDIFEVPGQQVQADSLPDLKPTGSIRHHQCDVADWASLRDAVISIGRFDIAVANAGVSQDPDYFQDVLDADGKLAEPKHRVVDINFRSVLNFTKLALRQFSSQPTGSSLVITASATGYSPEQSLPIYSATKHALIGLIRGLRPSINQYGATINGVAPAATISKLLPKDLAAPIIAAGAPVSSAYHVGLAVVYSAVATQQSFVETYGNDDAKEAASPGRWNGRIILTLGERWTEIEGPLASLRPQWFGQYNTNKTAFQQKLTDMRPRP